MTSILQRLDEIEAAILDLPTKTEIDLRINTITDTVGVFVSEIEEIKAKVAVYEFPENYQFILTEAELNFLTQGIASVSKLLVELEQLRVSLVRTQIT